jgi:hypothetical protein
MSIVLLQYNTVLEVLASTIRQEKKVSAIQIGKEEAKYTLVIDDKILYIEKTF